MPTASAAANAYAALARLTEGVGGAAKGAESAGPSFASVLKDMVGAVTEAGHKSDMQATAMVSGKANVVDVVTAVAETEVAIQTLVSVRDRVIQSYEEIMKMPI
jgi:flagellar hook-basal body complex protein FliE